MGPALWGRGAIGWGRGGCTGKRGPSLTLLVRTAAGPRGSCCSPRVRRRERRSWLASVRGSGPSMHFGAPTVRAPGQLPALVAWGCRSVTDHEGFSFHAVARRLPGDPRGAVLPVVHPCPLPWRTAFRVSSLHRPWEHNRPHFTSERTEAQKDHYQVRVSLLAPRGGECAPGSIPQDQEVTTALSRDAAVRWGPCVRRRVGCDTHPSGWSAGGAVV